MILYAVLGIILPFILTTIGSVLVLFIKNDFNKKLSAIIMGFSAGIMFAASIWSMILPSFDYTTHFKSWSFVPVVIGLILGCFFVLLSDIFLNKTIK